jgi:hypothetical protein
MREPRETPKKPTSLTELKQRRDGLIVPGPSGATYKIRALNLERHALNGGLPAKLRALALEGADGINKIFAADDGAISEHGHDVLTYLDGLVCETIVEPGLRCSSDKTVTDAAGAERALKKGDPDPDKIEFVPPVDYRWAVSIAMGEEDKDGEGRRLWGREPLSRYATFRDEHSCPPDCEKCGRALDRLSVGVAE